MRGDVRKSYFFISLIQGAGREGRKVKIPWYLKKYNFCTFKDVELKIKSITTSIKTAVFFKDRENSKFFFHEAFTAVKLESKILLVILVNY